MSNIDRELDWFKWAAGAGNQYEIVNAEIERLRKRVEELERGEVMWAVFWEDGFRSLALSQEAANKLAASVEYLEISYRIVKVRVTEIPEEEDE